MRSAPVFFDLTDTADERFDPVIEWMFIALLAFMPLSLGAVYAWSEMVVFSMVAAMVLLLSAKLLVRPDIRFVWSWTYVPIALFVLLSMMQLVPLPPTLVNLLSPPTLAMKRDLLAAVPESARHLDRITLSFYPEATYANLRMLIAVSAAYVVVVNVVRQMEQIRRILAAIAIIGCVVATIALLQDAFDADKIYFFINVYNQTAFFGPFANHSHYGQFMNLCIGAAMGLIFVHFGQLPSSSRRYKSSLAKHFARPVTRPVWALGCAIALMGITIFLSDSRGAMLSSFIAGAFTLLIMSALPGMRRRRWAMAGLVLVVVLGVLLFGFERVFERFAAVRDSDSLHGRREILRDAINAWNTFPVFGTGLGSFEQIFSSFDRSLIPTLATHAENEYAQLLMETGLIGALAIAAFIAIIAAAYFRCVRMAPSPMTSVALGLGFGLLAILVHSTTDFGQHVPANAFMTALFCGLLVNLARAVKLGHGAPSRVLFRGALWPRLVGAAAAASLVGLVLHDGINSWRAESQWNQAERMAQYLRHHEWSGDNADYYYLLLPAAEASRLRPGNIEYSYLLNFYRWKSISRERVFRGPSDLTPEQLGYTRRIVDELLGHAWRCPTYGPSYSLAGQLRRKILDESQGEQLVRQGYRLLPTNPSAVIEVALLEAEEGRWDEAMEKFRRAASLREDFRAVALDCLLNELHRPDLAMQLAENDVGALNQVVEFLTRRGTDPTLVAQARRRASALIREQARQPDASPGILIQAGREYRSDGDLDSAIAMYRRALQLEYGRNDWRLELARMLASAGRIPEAINEARIVHRGAGDPREAEKLIGEWSLMSLPGNTPATSPASLQTTAPSNLILRKTR